MIYPRCKADMNQIYVTAEGYITPCCWIGNEPEMTEYKHFHHGYFENLSLKNRDLEEILTDSNFLKIEKSWTTDTPYPICKKMCSKILPKEYSQVCGSNHNRRINLTNK